jgi:hypothetical protein
MARIIGGSYGEWGDGHHRKQDQALFQHIEFFGCRD